MLGTLTAGWKRVQYTLLLFAALAAAGTADEPPQLDGLPRVEGEQRLDGYPLLVLDRVVDGKYFVFLVGPREVELVVPADACTAGRAAAWCRAALEQDDAAARARIEDKLAQLRQRARPRRVVSGRLLTRLRAGRPGSRRRPPVAGAARAGAI